MALAEHPMSGCAVAGSDSIDLERNHLAVQKAKDRTQGADPAQGAGGPMHRFWPAKVGNYLGQYMGQYFCRMPTLDIAWGVKKCTFLFFAFFNLIAAQADRLEKTLDRSLWCINAWPPALLMLVGGV